MPRGRNKGENPFKESQDAKVQYREKRIKEVVVPNVRAIAPYVKISSINKFAKLVCEIYNSDLPVSDQPLSLRTVTQNARYWRVLGVVYYQLFDNSSKLSSFKNSIIQNDRENQILNLTDRLERLQAENVALKSVFTNTSGFKQEETEDVKNNKALREEYLCKLIDKLIGASDGVIQVDLKSGTIHNLADDLSNEEGLLPKEIVAPYIDYLNNLKDKFKPD